MIRIEYEEPTQSGPCACCGGTTTSLTRFVYEDDDAHAIYYARFSDNHPDRVVVATISLGEWGEDTPDQRVAFAVRIWSDGSNYNMGLIDAAESPWHDVQVIGNTLDRQEALAHPLLEEAFHITDHMVREDQAIKHYLDG
jgi:hypothetical protein